MGTYLTYVARSGAEQQINAAYRRVTGNPEGFLVYTEDVIKAEIAYVHSDAAAPAVHHMRVWLKTVEDWNAAFPVLATGRGQFKLQFGGGEVGEQEIAERRRDLKFILEHRFLFERIDGVDDALERGVTENPADALARGVPKKRESNSPQFSDLPRSNTKAYRLCVEHNRPDLWSAFHAYSKAQTAENWDEVKCKVIPWVEGGFTVWQRCERLATQLDGADYGLMGRYRGEETPAPFLVRKALSGDVFAH